MKNFDIKYKFNIGDRFIALRNIKYSDVFIKKGTIITIKGIGFNSIMYLEDPPIRRVDLRLDCYDGCFIYTNSAKIYDNIPNWYHSFNFSNFVSLKENRREKLKKLYDRT
jgi:hypothetical protein